MARADLNLTLETFQSQVDDGLAELAREQIVSRIWRRDHTVWKPDPTEIANRLGWLTVAEQMREHAPRLKEFARSVRAAGFRDVVLLGMGGSSLGPEVLRQTFGSATGFPRLSVLDSTVPGAVRAVTARIRPNKTLFIVASKSGGTIEVMSLFAHFWSLVQHARGNTGGQQFIAITDPDTSLGELAREHEFLHTFLNPADIGGRYSVLSYFGLVPAALIGLDIGKLLDRAITMAAACRADSPADNPGAVLGSVMGVLNRIGRDKVTIVASPQIQSFGLWAEQLLAESTGKEGSGLIPIADEPFLSGDAYGTDRLFVVLRLDRDNNDRLDRHVAQLRRRGHPVVEMRVRDRHDLGAEFFRWEFATAVAAYSLRIHPFDQPNVQESKDNTKRILGVYQRDRALPSVEGAQPLDALLGQAAPGSYVAVLAYAAPSRALDAAIKALRTQIGETHRMATTAGYGPRYLHSTGQLHKGGPKTGLFVELVDRMAPDVPVPGAPYSFGTLARAQAIGDGQSLQSHGRPVAFIELGRSPDRQVARLLGKPDRSRRRRPAPRSRGSGRGRS